MILTISPFPRENLRKLDTGSEGENALDVLRKLPVFDV